MMDFNFFSPYLKEKRNRHQRKVFTIAASALVLLALLSFTSINIYQINRYKQEISMVDSFMNSSKTIDLLGKYADTTKKLGITKEYYEKASEAAGFIKNSNTANTALLDKLSSVMTEDSTMTSLEINYNIIEVKYKVNNLGSAAEIEHNLRALDIFSSVHVSVVNNEEGYIATINCSLKDVGTSEAETNK